MWKTDGKKFQIGNSLVVDRENRLFLSAHVDDVKLAGKKQNLDPMWNILLTDVDLGELDHVYLSCTQRECKKKTSKDIVDNSRNMFESSFFQRNLWQTFLHGLMTWKVMQRNVWKHIANWRTKRLNNCTKSQLHVLTTINSKKKNEGSVG